MRVLIVGAGIMGLCTAWAAVKRGHYIIIAEQAATIPNPLSASGDQHRIIREAYGTADQYSRAIKQAFAAWDELWADIGSVEYSSTGVLALSRQPGDNSELLRDGLQRLGSPHQILSPRELSYRHPYLDGRPVRFAISCERGGVLHCHAIAGAIVRWLTARGARIQLNRKVTAIDAAGGRATVADGGDIIADR